MKEKKFIKFFYRKIILIEKELGIRKKRYLFFFLHDFFVYDRFGLRVCAFSRPKILKITFYNPFIYHSISFIGYVSH